VQYLQTINDYLLSPFSAQGAAERAQIQGSSVFPSLEGQRAHNKFALTAGF
jgi:hypothetical protein